MAKGGSGDLLTGLIAGLMAQYPDQAARAVEAAVYLHGLAADLRCARATSTRCWPPMRFGYLARAFQFPGFHFGKGDANGYVWLQGIACSRPARGSVND